MTPALKQALEQLEKLPPEQQDEVARLIRDQMSEPEAADDSELVKMALEAKELHRSGKTVPFDC
jgi:hypothetical protein